MKTYCAIVDVDEYDDRDSIITYCGSSLEKAKKSLSNSNESYEEWKRRKINSRNIMVWAACSSFNF